MTEEPDPREHLRRGGRLRFHATMTVLAVAVCVAGEVVGNLVFRRGHDLAAKAVEAAVFGAAAGNLLAWWLWRRAAAEPPPDGR